MTNTSNTFRIIQLSPKQQKELSEIKSTFTSLLLSQMKETKQNNAKIDLSTIWTPTEDLPELYEQLTDLKKCLDSFRPFNQAQLQNLQEVFDTEYTYASNRIEGNTLSLQETSFIINEGLTIKNKSVKEHLEAINHKEAIAFIRELVDQKAPINEKNIKLIHSIILYGIDRENAGRYRNVLVGIKGTDIVFPQPYIVPKLMEDLMFFYEENKDKLHPVQLAAQMHSKLVNIHPFIDGNGRTCRLLMNLILLQHGYPITVFSPEVEARNTYFEALNQVRNSKSEVLFELFVAQNVKSWIFTYLEFIAPNDGEEDQNKGYTFFKKIEPYLDSLKTDKSTNN
jgi:Fic family protein